MLAIEIPINLTYVNYITFTGELYFGADMQKAELVYDTGSRWLTVTADECQTCKTFIYKTTGNTSTTVNPINKDNI
jgi:hypothetical protein